MKHTSRWSLFVVLLVVIAIPGMLGAVLGGAQLRDPTLHAKHHDDAADAVNELIADHATNKTSHDAIETLVEELGTDHATFKTAADNVETLIEELHDDHATLKTAFDEAVGAINELVTLTNPNCVLYSATPMATAGVAVDDGSAADIQTTTAVALQINGCVYAMGVDAVYDTAGATCNGDTVSTSKAGAFWVFADGTGAISDIEDATGNAAVDTTAIQALAGYSTATNTLPPSAADVCIGVISLVEGGSGTFTFGTDSLTDETEVYYSFEGLPGIETALASFAADASPAATFTYGTCTLRLGSGTRVSATGKANATIGGSNVADTKTGAWLFYILADDTEIMEQLGAAYANLAAAQVAVRDHTPNPLMPVAGVLYVQNASGGAFVPGTTNLSTSGLTCTFTTVGPGANHLEYGRAALGQPIQVMQNAGPASLTATKPASAPATLSATTTISSGPAALTATTIDTVAYP